MEEKYKASVEPYKGSLSDSERVFEVGGKKYIVSINESNVGNHPGVFGKIKDLAATVIKENTFLKDGLFTIDIRTAR